MEKIKQYSVILLFFLFIFGFSLAHFLLPDEEFSSQERKPLAQAPELTAQGIFSGDYFTDAETYLLDQFPLRYSLLNCKRFLDKNIYLMSSSGGYSSVEDHLTKLDPKLDEAQVQHAIDLINRIIDSLPEVNSLHYGIIPDKNYFISQISNQPALDYNRLYAMAEQIHAQEIDLRPLLSLDDYYRTDSHWKQERILPVAEAICKALGVTVADPDSYSPHSLEGFKGVYYELTDTPPEPDTLTYLTNAAIEGAVVSHMNDRMQWEAMSVYTEENFGKANTDSYDVFLDGPEPLITIENPNAGNDRHLILFRDSFGSSLTPLLVDSYAKITVVDLRYVNWHILQRMNIDYKGADVLFLYGTTLLNSAISAGLR
ncbi:MAG: hypothetical protein II272_06215 [Oscillospiraceae bacterium]|nr:hypothetical protein [Oscillospiraceae bacterium]